MTDYPLHLTGMNINLINPQLPWSLLQLRRADRWQPGQDENNLIYSDHLLMLKEMLAQISYS